jgi:hypothetical protein
MAAYRFILDKEHKADLIAILHFRLWMVIKKDKVEASALIKLIDRVKKTSPDTFLTLSLRDFGWVYTAAQFTLNRISGSLGVEYLDEMSTKSPEWKSAFREDLMESCMYFVNDCNSKFEEIPEFMRLRQKIESDIQKGL